MVILEIMQSWEIMVIQPRIGSVHAETQDMPQEQIQIRRIKASLIESKGSASNLTVLEYLT